MELNWSTFVFEIINFLILVWILKRFFYRPVRAAIARRRDEIDASLATAASRIKEAKELENTYEARLQVWEQEKEAARAVLHDEIAAERKRLRHELKAELEQERERARVIERRRLETAQRQNEELAITHGARFTSRLLERLATPELEQRLFELLLTDIEDLPLDQSEALAAMPAGEQRDVSVASVWPLDDERRQRLEQTLRKLIGTALRFEYREDPELLAGLRVTLGPTWVVRANLHDELGFFVDQALRRHDT